jgi:hypothetical protein
VISSTVPIPILLRTLPLGRKRVASPRELLRTNRLVYLLSLGFALADDSSAQEVKIGFLTCTRSIHGWTSAIAGP